MISLEKQSGLPLFWDTENKKIVFGEGLDKVEPIIRTKKEIQEVLFEAEEGGPEDLYYMYRGVVPTAEKENITEQGLRFDITVLRPGTIGREYIKTAGHYHPLKPGTNSTFPEVYEVLFGKAHYLLQRPCNENYAELEKALLISAKPGDKVLIPPGYGHITINPGDDYLIISNWVANGFSLIYDPITEKKGGGYFELKDDEGPVFLPNSRYKHLPSLKRCSVTPVPKFKLHTGLPVYRVFHEDPGSFSFLLYPENYEQVFEEYLHELIKDSPQNL